MAAELDIAYRYKTRPSSLLSSIFMSTLNAAAKTLVSVARTEQAEKWKAKDHLRFMVMLMTWMAVWVLRFLMDYLPCSIGPSPRYLLGFSSAESLDFSSTSLSSSSSSMLSSFPSLDLVVHEGVEGSSVQALGRALSQILVLLTEIPATSGKYQFAMAMADRIMDENARYGHEVLLHINRTALASAFSRTSNLLYRALERSQGDQDDDNSSYAWATRVIRALPMGTYLTSYMKGLRVCMSAIMSTVANINAAVGTYQSQKRRRQVGVDHHVEEVTAEKLAQELLWMTTKLRDYGAVDEALVQWSFASGLASFSLTANVRVQGFIVKISAILFRELVGEDLVISSQIKFRILLFWLPLFCHASNGLAYPVLSRFEKMEVERAIDEALSTLPAADQEVILTNWLQDFTIAASDWPNLQYSYDRWCQSSRKVVT
ncbi:uncharacterized protein LOC122309140 [Carya illinoinensis]|uniref:At3g05675-like ankyrin-like domain-containing protein n=1 Tax=Carya illinoinensis TaxID=32201 RepID=A0A8T1QL36_CARIL|nr:uncharacterized protein LOC122309140 [Carya illinoinensis]KAG6654802.1 hypothetical protein CIPAW_05G170600 [Carya illinoinensis]